jgi:predicted lipoprotein with Yx(FWY)xxD motif
VRRLIVLALAAVLAISAALAGIAIAASKPTKPATVKTRTAGDLGKIIVDGRSRTLYLFEKDKNGKSSCSGACATNWPPLLTKGKPKASGSVKASKLGTTKRSDGTTQVTYGGHPLYTFLADKNKPGSTKGQELDAFGAEWYVVGTNGKKVEEDEG